MAKRNTGGVESSAKVTALLKKPEFHILCVMGFLFVTTIVADDVVSALNRSSVVEMSASVAQFLRNLSGAAKAW
eukprot:CAMPEP_0182442692 /NCGR_PEP_ID=MMETSP1172-20130603/1611_1 /TAXON_ID=708627 /ORGANISM="Timspurckia oligopyrenoides, Strain CCMP3278" /LENGTH=73 /DNA_ID=CAMNT_0024637707 /DNA_START=52 /DNA_END=270 /DNA_ORIENTATION=+